jgi:hypothetical protein
MTILENLMQTLYGNSKQAMSQTSRNGQLPFKAMNADAVARLLESLLPGESATVTGKVMDLRQNQVILQLTSGETLNARTETTLPLSIGDTADFIVTGKDGKLITLKLAKGDENSESAKTQKTVTKALEAAGIASTERSETVVRELMSHSQPLNEANIKKFMALSAKNPDIPVRELVLMDIAKIPITKENIQIYRDFGNSEPVAEFAAAVSEISESIETLPDPKLGEELSNELKNILKDMLEGEQPESLTENPSPAASGDQAVQQEAAKTPIEPATNPPQEQQAVDKASAPEVKVLNEEIKKEGPSTEETVAAKNGELPEKTPEKEVVQKPLSKSANAIHRALHMPPKDFADPTKIKKLYEKLESASDRLKKLEDRVNAALSENAKESAAKAQPQTHAGRLSSTLRFMDSVNNIFPFVQLPIKLKEENARGDLYVYEKKRAFKDGDTVSALLHLDLDNLGETDILIKLTGKNAVITISAATEASRDIFSSEIPALTEALNKKGYSLNCDVNVTEEKEEKAPLLTRFLEAHSPSLVSRFSFDMRA